MLTRRSFIACAALLALSSWVVPPVFAQSGDKGATAFIQTLGNETIATFADKSLSRQQAVDRFKSLLNKGFDVPYIGRWVLGRYWNQASPQEQQEYQRLFEQLVVETYANRFVDYAGETFKITGSAPAGENDSMVATQVVRTNGPPINVEWRVRSRDNGHKIIDVVVEGVSMGVTQRSEFASVIQSNGGRIAGLIDALRQRVSKG